MKPKTNTAMLEYFLGGNRNAEHRNLEIKEFKLYNYGTLIAWFEDGAVKITDIKYSQTTSKICGQLSNLALVRDGEAPERKSPPEQ